MLAGIVVLVVLAYCLWEWLRPDPIPLCGVYRQPGQWYYVKKNIFSFVFYLRKWRSENANNESMKYSPGYGISSKSSVGSIDQVQPLFEDGQAMDATYFAGFGKDGTNIVCRIARRHRRQAELWLFLEVPGIGCLQHPLHPDTMVYNTDGASFTAGGLQFEVLEPMRRWRLSFNGLLRNGLSNDIESREGEFVHVKFSFIWHAFNDPIDFNTALHLRTISDAVAREPWSKLFWDRLRSKHQSHYEQWGELNGNLYVEGHEGRALHLKCLRDHTYGVRDWRSFHRYVVHFIYLQSGITAQCGIVSMPDTLSHLMVGYLSFPSGETVAVSDVNLNMEELGEYTETPDHYNFSFTADGKNYDVAVQGGTTPVWYHYEDRSSKVEEKFCNYVINGVKGYGLVEFCYRNPEGPCMKSCQQSLLLVTSVDTNLIKGRRMALTLRFTDPSCCSPVLVGGKGAQLGQLTSIQANLNATVPNGICVTTCAYEEHIKSNPILTEMIGKIQQASCSNETAELKSLCEDLTSVFKFIEITASVQQAITAEIDDIWCDRRDQVRLAVRSSAAGEDGTEASTAGQLDTYLGVRGLEQVLESVVKCWASAFTFVAVEYKRQHGQEVAGSVGVVIQEMVPADTAGVLFTKDPVTDNSSILVLNANYGLGETVVSGTATPDTVHLSRTWDDQLTILRKDIGHKTDLINMSDIGGVESTSVEDDLTDRCCLDDDTILQIGSVGVMLEKYYGSARDVEWAMLDQKLYLLQARPITSQDGETDEDLMHEFDSALTSDKIWLTTGNVGEMMPGAVTPLTNSIFARECDLGLQDMVYKCGAGTVTKFSGKTVVNFCNHLFINLHHLGHFSVNMAIGNKAMTEISIVGEVLDDLSESDVRKYVKEQGTFSRFWNCFKLIAMYLEASRRCKEWEKIVDGYVISQSEDAATLYRDIHEKLKDYYQIWADTAILSSKSGTWSHTLLAVLNKGKPEITSEHFADIANLLSDCTDVTSVDVPVSLQRLAAAIDKAGQREQFVAMQIEEATLWILSSDSGDVGRRFAEFLRDHGHRCIREAEFLEKSWSAEPSKLIRIIQTMLKQGGQLRELQKQSSVEEAISKLNTHVSWFGRLMLKYLIPRARAAVGGREWGKSLAMKMCDKFKEAYWKLASCMVNEGRLMDAELLFFLSHHEIGQLIQARSPKLISRATRRRKLHPKMMAMEFPKYSIGHAVPLPDVCEEEFLITSVKLKGMPVSQGEVKGTARVVKTVEDAHTIETGDVLIVPYTDVGWSPYFPLIGGLVTEIGGLLSHGAVVAREYGLPCVVNVPRATSIFRSGDKVVLNGTKGVLEKITE